MHAVTVVNTSLYLILYALGGIRWTLWVNNRRYSLSFNSMQVVGREGRGEEGGGEGERNREGGRMPC